MLLQNESEQRTEEWHLARMGKFTASPIYQLLGIKALGLTGEGYAFNKAIQELFGETEDPFISYEMQVGIDTEPLAFAHFKGLKALEFIEVTTCGFFEYNEHCGASPDGLVGDDGILEIKCPKASTFFKLVADGEIDKKYMAQMQMQMMCTGRTKAYFFNFLVIRGEKYWHEIVVERDEDMIDLIKARIAEAVAVKNNFIKKINKNKQY
jgi:exodeoxyribonuclease (lambda-induced)